MLVVFIACRPSSAILTNEYLKSISTGSDFIIVAPKNSGLRRYREIALSYLADAGHSRIVEVRGEDVAFWVRQLQEKGKKVIGLTGEDLYNEYCIKERENKLKVIKRISWDDPTAMFGKPTLCLMGPKGTEMDSMPKELTVCISSKYKRTANKYLNALERKGFKFSKIYVNGCVEMGCSEGIADLIIDIVYTGSSMKKYGIQVYDRIIESDFLIIGE